MKNREVVKCAHCRLVQYQRNVCPRCGTSTAGEKKPEPLQPVVYNSFPDPLPSLAEMQELLLAEAMRRTGGDRQLVAQIVGLCKTTIYRKFPNK